MSHISQASSDSGRSRGSPPPDGGILKHHAPRKRLRCAYCETRKFQTVKDLAAHILAKHEVLRFDFPVHDAALEVQSITYDSPQVCSTAAETIVVRGSRGFTQNGINGSLVTDATDTYPRASDLESDADESAQSPTCITRCFPTSRQRSLRRGHSKKYFSPGVKETSRRVVSVCSMASTQSSLGSREKPIDGARSQTGIRSCHINDSEWKPCQSHTVSTSAPTDYSLDDSFAQSSTADKKRKPRRKRMVVPDVPVDRAHVPLDFSVGFSKF